MRSVSNTLNRLGVKTPNDWYLLEVCFEFGFDDIRKKHIPLGSNVYGISV